MSVKCTCKRCGIELELPNGLSSSTAVKVEPKYSNEGYDAYIKLEGLLSLLTLLTEDGRQFDSAAEKDDLWATFSLIDDLAKTAVGSVYK